ncbi:hypothetical protein GCM10023100_70550 [Actinocorallia cavernae]|uniref:Uncharacterized protein n=2 Tax=Actinomycetes TaxID=1760 RepID=A0ABP8T9F4_9ACTN
MLTMATPIIPDIMYVVGPALRMENISTMAPLPSAMGRYISADPKSALAGSPRTGGSASSTCPSGSCGPSARGERLATTVLNGRDLSQTLTRAWLVNHLRVGAG